MAKWKQVGGSVLYNQEFKLELKNGSRITIYQFTDGDCWYGTIRHHGRSDCSGVYKSLASGKRGMVNMLKASLRVYADHLIKDLKELENG